jgi:hypothetical protein
MGAWGTAITSDDTVLAVIEFVAQRLKSGDGLQAACKAAEHNFQEELRDEDDGPLVWLALAHVQWKYGEVTPRISERVRADFRAGRGLERWRDDPKQLQQRQAVLAKFLSKIETPNPKPARAPKKIIRLAPFAAGDCLAVRLADGQHTGAIVLRVDNSNEEHGASLIGSLDYLASSPPEPSVFEQRVWLYKHHGNWNGEPELHWYGSSGLRKERERIAVIYKTKLRPTDPTDSRSLSNLARLGTQIILCRGSGST